MKSRIVRPYFLILLFSLLSLFISSCKKEHKWKDYEGNEPAIAKVAFGAKDQTCYIDIHQSFIEVDVFRNGTDAPAMDVSILNLTVDQGTNDVFTPESSVHFAEGATKATLRVNFDLAKYKSVGLFYSYQLDLKIDFGEEDLSKFPDPLKDIPYSTSVTLFPRLMFETDPDVPQLYFDCDINDLCGAFSVQYDKKTFESENIVVCKFLDKDMPLQFVLEKQTDGTYNLSLAPSPQIIFGGFEFFASGTAKDLSHWDFKYSLPQLQVQDFPATVYPPSGTTNPPAGGAFPINFTVMDGASPVKDAKITVTDSQGSAVANSPFTTDAEGKVSTGDLAAGDYTYTVEATGFTTKSDVKVTISDKAVEEQVTLTKSTNP